MYSGVHDPMPSDKLMKLFIIQAISSFVATDYDSGMHYLNEIKQTYAEKMSSLNPTLKVLAKEIIQSLDMFAPGSTPVYASPSPESTAQEPAEDQPPAAASEPSSVTSELQELLRRRREKRQK